MLENLDKTHPDIALRTEQMKTVYNPKAAELKTSEKFKEFKENPNQNLIVDDAKKIIIKNILFIQNI